MESSNQFLGTERIGKLMQKYAIPCIISLLVSSIVLAALYLIFADTILAMFGGTVNAETYHHSQEYFFYITLGIPF